ncbi:MAG: radical SAM protein [Candidatus Omnitrophota bacterium]
MKILLIFPRIKYGEHSPPLGLGYLASALEQGKEEVVIADLTFEKDYEFLKNKLKEFKPELIGVTCQTTFAESAFKVTRLCKSIFPDVPVVIGGPHPTILPEKTLAESKADIVVLGEGEGSLVEIVDKFKNKQRLNEVKGIYFNQDGKIVFTGVRDFIVNLDKIPFPSRHLFDQRYFDFPEVTLISSRGCPFNCSFCQPTLKKMFGNKVRLRSPDNVVDEIEFILQKYPQKTIRFHDDTFTWNNHWIKSVCGLIKERKLQFSWNCKSRIDVLDEESISLLKDAGCQRLDLGVESGSVRILDEVLNKGVSIKKIKNAFDLCAKLNMPTLAFIMIGAPTETAADILDTISLLEDITFMGLHVSLFTPFPGTEIFDYAKSNDLICAVGWNDYDFYSSVSLKSENFQAKEIKNMRLIIEKGVTAYNLFKKEGGVRVFMIKHPLTFLKYIPYYFKLKILKNHLKKRKVCKLILKKW